MNNQLFINCYKIWHMYRFIIINNKIFIYNLHLLLLFSYIPIFRGLCPQGVMSAGGFVRRGFYSGGYVCRGFYSGGYVRRGFYSGGYVRRGFYSGGFVRRGLCPRFRFATGIILNFSELDKEGYLKNVVFHQLSLTVKQSRNSLQCHHGQHVHP